MRASGDQSRNIGRRRRVAAKTKDERGRMGGPRSRTSGAGGEAGDGRAAATAAATAAWARRRECYGRYERYGR